MSYATLAPFYDLENADFVADLDFWVSLAREANSPVLELGCGSGRVTQQIARAGINIVGLDNSPDMLALARAKLDRNPKIAALVTLVEGDMTNFEISNPQPHASRPHSTLPHSHTPTPQFSLIIVPFNTFMHLLTPADQLAMLGCAHKHLCPGGQLILDLTNPIPAYADPPQETLTLERAFRDDARDLTIQQFSTLRIDRAAQIAHIVYYYDSLASDGTLKRALVPLTLRYTFPAEMSLLLDRAGFKLAHLYGDYSETPFDEDSERMIVMAEAV